MLPPPHNPNPRRRGAWRGRSMGRGERSGVEIAELAFCLPVMVVIVFGTLELCQLMFLKQSLSVASYEASRLAARQGATNAAVETRFQQIMTSRRVRNAAITISPSDLTRAARGDTITIDVQAPVAINASTSLVLGSSIPSVVERAVVLRE